MALLEYQQSRATNLVSEVAPGVPESVKLHKRQVMVCNSASLLHHGSWIHASGSSSWCLSDSFSVFLQPTMSLMPALSPMATLIYPPESVVSTPTELVNGGQPLHWGRIQTVHLSLRLEQKSHLELWKELGSHRPRHLALRIELQIVDLSQSLAPQQQQNLSLSLSRATPCWSPFTICILTMLWSNYLSLWIHVNYAIRSAHANVSTSAREVFGHYIESVKILVVLNPTGCMLTSSGIAFIHWRIWEI